MPVSLRFDHHVADPCGSASSSKTRLSSEENAAAKLIEEVVFPTPPLPFTTAITFGALTCFEGDCFEPDCLKDARDFPRVDLARAGLFEDADLADVDLADVDLVR